MATILAQGITDADSTSFTILAGEVITVGAFTSPGERINRGEFLSLEVVTPSGSNRIAKLELNAEQVSVTGPGEFFVRRSGYNGAPVGVFLEI